MTEIAGTKRDWLEKTFGLLLMIYALVAPISISATYIALVLIVIAGIALLFRKGASHLSFQMNLLIPFCLLYIWSAVTALLAGSFSSETAFRGIKELSPIVLFPLFLNNVRVEKERVVMALLACASLVCLLGLIQFFIPSVVYPIPQQIIWEGEFRGFFGGMNHFGSGGFFSITTVLSFALILFWQCSSVKKLFLWVFFLLNIAALSLTFARSYYVSVGVVLFLLLLLKNWKWFTFGGIFFAAILIFILSSPNTVNYRIRTLADPTYSSNTARIFIWKLASDMIKEHSITGVGRGGWEREVKNVYYPIYKDKHTFTDSTFVNAHNTYLYILAETGIVGLLLFSSLWGGIIWRFYKGLSLDRSSFDFSLIAASSAALGNLLVAGLFECNLETMVVLLLISFLVAISLPVSREVRWISRQ